MPAKRPASFLLTPQYRVDALWMDGAGPEVKAEAPPPLEPLGVTPAPSADLHGLEGLLRKPDPKIALCIARRRGVDRPAAQIRPGKCRNLRNSTHHQPHPHPKPPPAATGARGGRGGDRARSAPHAKPHPQPQPTLESLRPDLRPAPQACGGRVGPAAARSVVIA